MEEKKVDVVIPVYRPGKEFQRLISRLMKQSIAPAHIRIIQTVQTEEESVLPSEESRIVVEPVLQSVYDHGGTRDWGAKQSNAEYILFMTQDAMPVDDKLIENLLQAMTEEQIGIAYARQLARPEAGRLERLTREYNYPAESRVKSLSDVERLGIKTYFCSDVCAMYRKSYYEELGGFVKPTIFNEDMIMAYHMIQAGYQVAYCADAKVVHSHDYSCIQQFHRNFDLGVSQKQYSDIFKMISSEKEGAGYAMKTLKELAGEGHFLQAFYFALQCGFKLFGYKLGLHYDKLPRSMVMRFTGSKWYWK